MDANIAAFYGHRKIFFNQADTLTEFALLILQVTPFGSYIMAEKVVIEIDEDLEDLVPDFIENRHNDVVTIGNCIETADFAELKRLGHILKGAGSGYGFDEISAIGTEMENAADGEELMMLQQLRDRLDNYLNGIDIVYVEME
mgnify:CR=1 FL=1